MPKNHYLCQAYLRGFASPDGELQEMDTQGNLRIVKTKDVCFEKASPEPLIEQLRKDVENWWGTYRENIRTDLHLPSNRGQKEKVAEFAAKTIALSKVGRVMVRSKEFRAQREYYYIDGVAKILKENFLKLNWMIVKPLYKLLTGDGPCSWKMSHSNPNEVVAMYFPMTSEYLLCLGSMPEYVGFKVHSDNEGSNGELSLAATAGLHSNLDLMKGLKDKGGNLYAPLDYNWKLMQEISLYQ